MIDQGFLDYIDFVEEQAFRQLISAPKSKDYSLRYYSMELKKQRASEKEMRNFCRCYAEEFANRVRNAKKELTEREQQELTKECLNFALLNYKK